MTERTTPTPDQLRASSVHLHYEVTMFDATARALMTGVFGQSVARNAFLESFGIHTRILKEFFHPSGAKDNTVLAEHYFADPMTWRNLRGRLPKALKVDRRVGTEIAHLTYDRLDVSPEAGHWNILEIWEAMGQLITAFVQHVPPQHLAPIWTPPAEGSDVAVTTTTTQTIRNTPVVTMVNTPTV